MKQQFISFGEKMQKLNEATVRRLKTEYGKEYISENHYSHGSHNGIISYGLYDDSGLRGVCGFSCPCSENVRISVCGEKNKDKVIELSRLVCDDDTPKNTESFFVSRAIKSLCNDFPTYKILISFADETQGHKGTIYKALNFMFCGWTAEAKFYLDKDNRLRHPHQNGKNITTEQAMELGWTPVKRKGKRRFLLLIGNRKENRQILKELKWQILQYPEIKSGVEN